MSETAMDRITQSWITETLRTYREYIADLEPARVVELMERQIDDVLEEAQKDCASEAQWEAAANVMVGMDAIIPGVRRDTETGEAYRNVP